jgi:hypothetical protein
VWRIGIVSADFGFADSAPPVLAFHHQPFHWKLPNEIYPTPRYYLCR